ncbi:MAG: hypothetical protein KKG78_10145, partial [Alphaproteobacteria bacterium]|nr:hypothetical protein [Alphaproteobacteria bacterium]
MYAHSVEKRFIQIVCAALLLLIAPLFALFFHLSYERAATENRKNIDLTMVANVQALGKPLWDFDVDSVNGGVKPGQAAAQKSATLCARMRLPRGRSPSGGLMRARRFPEGFSRP